MKNKKICKILTGLDRLYFYLEQTPCLLSLHFYKQVQPILITEKNIRVLCINKLLLLFQISAHRS